MFVFWPFYWFDSDDPRNEKPPLFLGFQLFITKYLYDDFLEVINAFKTTMSNHFNICTVNKWARNTHFDDSQKQSQRQDRLEKWDETKWSSHPET